MKKSISKKAVKSAKVANREFVDHPDKLMKAILKAVGALKPGEGLEIRRVRDPNYKVAAPTKKKVAARKVAAQG